MDIATVSIIATASIGMLAVGGTVWNSLQPAKVAREARIEQRRAEAYLEILRLAEQESLYYNARLTNLLIEATEAYPGIESTVSVPEEPPVESRAILAAHVAAFASNEMAADYRTWRTRMDEVRGEYQDIGFYWTETLGGHGPVGVERLAPMRDRHLPTERRAREVMANRAAVELRHRLPERRRRLRRTSE